MGQCEVLAEWCNTKMAEERAAKATTGQQQSSSWDMYKLPLSKAVKTFYFTEDQVNSASTSSSDHAHQMPKRKSMCPDGHIWPATFSDEGEKDIQG